MSGKRATSAGNGVDGLKTSPAQQSGQAAASPVFTLTQKKSGVVATAQEVDGEFTVRAGSLARIEWIENESSYARLQHRLKNDGVIMPSPHGPTCRVVRDQVLASPSAAAAVLLERSANGRQVWSVEGTGQTYHGWQTAQLADAGALSAEEV